MLGALLLELMAAKGDCKGRPSGEGDDATELRRELVREERRSQAKEQRSPAKELPSAAEDAVAASGVAPSPVSLPIGDGIASWQWQDRWWGAGLAAAELLIGFALGCAALVFLRGAPVPAPSSRRGSPRRGEEEKGDEVASDSREAPGGRASKGGPAHARGAAAPGTSPPRAAMSLAPATPELRDKG